MKARPMLIGLHNPHSPRPRDALAPYPAGCAGDRIVELIKLVEPSFSVEDYLATFERVNLWKGMELPRGEGATALLERDGRRLLRACLKTPRAVIALGAKVWACVLARTPPAWFSSAMLGESMFWYLPHPSGLNRIYNTTTNRERAGRALLEAMRWTPSN